MAKTKVHRVYKSGEGRILELTDGKHIRFFKDWESQRNTRGNHTYIVIPQKNSGEKMQRVEAKNIIHAIHSYIDYKKIEKSGKGRW